METRKEQGETKSYGCREAMTLMCGSELCLGQGSHPCLFTPKENLSWRIPRITEKLRLEKPVRSPSPNINPTFPCSPLNHVPKCHTHIFFEHFWRCVRILIPKILSIIRDDLPSLKLSTEVPAELQATKHNLEKACVDGFMERIRLITQRGPKQ